MPSLRRVPLLALASLALAVAASCGPPGGAASSAAKAPEFQPKDQAKCQVKASQAEPLVVEWPSAARQKLESLAQRGQVAVKYDGCAMEVLTDCRVAGKYRYVPTTLKRDRVSIQNDDDLFTNLPAGAFKLQATLKRAGELNVAMTLVGRYESDAAGELTGACDGATHVIRAFSVGAFEFFAGADAAVGGEASAMGVGAGAQSHSRREMLSSDGDPRGCDRDAPAPGLPPRDCGAIIRVEVVPVADRPRPQPSSPPPGPAATVAPLPGPAATVAPPPGPAATVAPLAQVDHRFLSVERGELKLKEKIMFDVGRANIKAESRPLLDELATVLNASPSITLEVQVHTDSQGNHAANVKLSQERAEAVRQELVRRGVAASRLISKGYGPDRPLDPGTTPEAYERNRRVALVRTDGGP